MCRYSYIHPIKSDSGVNEGREKKYQLLNYNGHKDKKTKTRHYDLSLEAFYG